jgi:hypothetical protein
MSDMLPSGRRMRHTRMLCIGNDVEHRLATPTTIECDSSAAMRGRGCNDLQRVSQQISRLMARCSARVVDCASEGTRLKRRTTDRFGLMAKWRYTASLTICCSS